MANFKTAYKKTGGYEGFYANVSGDRGGETYCGIARVFWPNWKGWKIVDQFKKDNGGSIKPRTEIKNPELTELVESFYKTNFWNVVGGDNIEDQKVANTLYDFGVNSGQSRSIKNIQKVLGLPETGKISKGLIEMINDPLDNLIKNEK